MKKIILSLFACICAMLSYAQMSALLYNSKHIPQINQMNPALFTNSGFYLSLPSVNLNFDSPLAFSDLYVVKPNEEGQNITYIDIDGILANLEYQNEINTDLNVGILGLGFRTKHGFVSLSTQLRTNFQLGVPKDIIRFITRGNVGEDGRGMDLVLLDQDLFSLTSYLEAGIGVGREFGKKFTVGVRAKVLLGLINASTYNSSVRLATDPDFNSFTVDMNYHVRASTPISLNELLSGKSISSIIGDDYMSLIPRNWGMAFDIGAKYKITKRLSVAASVLDIGTIHWVENLAELSPEEGTGSFTFSGLGWETMFSNGEVDDDFASSLLDSVVYQLTQYEIDTLASDYWERVPMRLNFSATYDLNKMLSASVMYRREMNKFNYFQSLTAGLNINLGNWMELMACNSVHNFEDWLNPGIGMSFSFLKMIQVYTLFDYVSDIYIVDGKSFRFFFGLNLTFANNRERKQAKITNQHFSLL